MEHHTNELLTQVLQIMASEKKKSLHRIKKLLTTEPNRGAIRRFWQLLDEKYPDHTYQHLSFCSDCGALELTHEPFSQPLVYLDGED